MPADQYEVEQKFRVPNLDTVRVSIEQLGAKVSDGFEQADSYFAHPSRDFASTDEALRIRRVGLLNLITYKGPKIDTTTKTRREIELPLPGGELYANQFTQLLLALGFSPVAVVHKTRRTAIVEWRSHQVEVAFDEVAQVGSFIELEVQADETGLAEAREVVVSLADELRLDQAERRSYLEMLLGE